MDLWASNEARYDVHGCGGLYALVATLVVNMEKPLRSMHAWDTRWTFHRITLIHCTTCNFYRLSYSQYNAQQQIIFLAFISHVWKASNKCGCEEIHNNAFHLHSFIQMDKFQICLECCNQADPAQTNSPGHRWVLHADSSSRTLI